MKYVSLFSGIEAATVAWEPLGWEPLAFSEIDAFPCAVLAERFPGVPNLGDITKIDWKMVRRKYGQIDLVVGGSPCQSFSIAGGRTGLEGASGLMWEYVRCVREVKPRWILWENVPGALSSSHGEDFRCLLEALDACGYGLAWRVLDSQFFGLAQRRERLFVVGCLGDVERPCEVLFEPESLRWDPPSSREKRKELAAGAGGGAACAGFRWNAGGKTALSVGETSPTVTSSDSPAVYQIAGNIIGREDKNGGHQLGVVDPDEHGAFTLNTADRHAVVMCMTDTQPHSMVDGEVCGALTATMHKDPPVVGFADRHAVAFAQNTRDEVRLIGGDGDVTGALAADPGMKQTSYVAQKDMSVRRLTPRECERLQGFPSVVELEVEKMTPNELIACALANGDIFCDFDTGEVYGTRGPGGIKLKEPRKLGFKHPSGYIHVSLHAGREKKQVRAHRIVYMAAYGEIPDGMVIDHVNNDKSDNRLSNLQMMTPEENSRKAAMEDRYLSGEENPRCKIGAEVRTKMMHDYSEHGMTYRDLARKYGVSKSRVGQIAHEDDWTRIPYRGKPAEECPDTPRYKALGNSMAVPVMRWIGERMEEVER